MSERKILYADDGKVLTNGTIYGKVIYLAEGADESEYYSITKTEYDEIMNSEQAEEADYIESLERFGVK